MDFNILSKEIPEKYHFVLNRKVFEFYDYVGKLFVFKLINTRYYFILNLELDQICWFSDSYHNIVTFEDIFDSVSSDIGTELIFHLNILSGEKN